MAKSSMGGMGKMGGKSPKSVGLANDNDADDLPAPKSPKTPGLPKMRPLPATKPVMKAPPAPKTGAKPAAGKKMPRGFMKGK